MTSESRHRRLSMPSLFLWAGGLMAMLAVGGCGRPFDVNVGTEEPIQVNLSVDVNVYQHGQADEAAAEARASIKEAMEGMRNRMAELQELKDKRLVGENHQGRLEIRELPAGDYGTYVRETVEAENADREVLIAHEAQERGMTVPEVRRSQWRQRQRRSFPGEWVQVEAEEPGAYRWVNKEGAAEATEGG